MSALLQGVKVFVIAGDRGATAVRFLTSLGAKVLRSDDVASADLLIGSRASDFRKGGAFEKLREINPRLITVSITPFGLTGPYADYDGPEIVVSAMGGCLGVVGYDDRPPVKEALDACGFHAEMMAAAGAMFALLAASLVVAAIGYIRVPEPSLPAQEQPHAS